MTKSFFGRPILALRLRELEHLHRLQQVVLQFDKTEKRLFNDTDLEGLCPETRQDLAGLTLDDLYQGYYWQIADNPEKVGFWFYCLPRECLYLTNVPYLVVHHSPSGFSWGFSGSGPTDLGLNLGEYFCRKLGWTEPTVTLWKQQTASALAYAARFEIRDWLNQTLSTNRQHISYEEVEQAVTQILEAERNKS